MNISSNNQKTVKSVRVLQMSCSVYLITTVKCIICLRRLAFTLDAGLLTVLSAAASLVRAKPTEGQLMSLCPFVLTLAAF